MEKNIRDLWQTLITKFMPFEAALADRSDAGDDRRRELRRDALPSRPIAQLAIVLAVTRMINAVGKNGSKLSLNDIVDRLNELDWKTSNPLWQNILLAGDRLVTGRTAARFAARMIGYMCGDELSEIELGALKEQYASRFPEEQRQSIRLPPKIGL